MVQPVFDEKSAGKAPPATKPQLGAFIYLLGTAAVIGGFLFGYDTGVMSSAMLYLPDAIPDIDYLWQEMIISITLVGCAIFSLIAGPVADRVGRRPVILAASAMFSVGAAVMAAAPERFTLLAGRLLVGAAIGFASMVVPVYVSESCPVTIRGLMVTGFQLMITFGIFSASLLGAAFSYLDPTRVGWRLMLGFAAVPGIVQFICFLFLPESPRYLATHGKEDDAEAVLRRIYPKNEEWVKFEMEEIMEYDEQIRAEHATNSNEWVIVRMMKTPHVRKALIIGTLIMIFPQLSGINTLMYYTATVVKMGGIRSSSSAIWVASGIAAVNFLFTFVPIVVVERAGRRILLLASTAGVVVALAILGVGFLLINNDSAETAHMLDLNQTIMNDDMKDYFKECRLLSNCDNCVTLETCGFCFEKGADEWNATSYGWCLPTVAVGNSSQSLVGACSNASAIDEDSGSYTWASNWCISSYSWLPIVGMVLYLCFFSVGMGPMPWVYNAEIYPNWARSTGAAIATAAGWTCNTIISLTFLTLTAVLGKFGAFFLYGGVATVAFVIFFFVVPETKGIPIEEVEKLFMSKAKRQRHEAQERRIHAESIRASMSDKY